MQVRSASARAAGAAALSLAVCGAAPVAAALAARKTAPVVRSGRYVGRVQNSHAPITVVVSPHTVKIRGGYLAKCVSGQTLAGTYVTKPTPRRNDSVLSGEKAKDRRLVYFEAQGHYATTVDGLAATLTYDVFGGPISKKSVSGGAYVDVVLHRADGSRDECATDASGTGASWYTLGAGDGYTARRVAK
jgi:hypothetical protein